MGYRLKGRTGLKTWSDKRPFPNDPAGGMKFPPGLATEDYQVEVYVKATDSIGGVTISPAMYVTVSIKRSMFMYKYTASKVLLHLVMNST